MEEISVCDCDCVVFRDSFTKGDTFEQRLKRRKESSGYRGKREEQV